MEGVMTVGERIEKDFQRWKKAGPRMREAIVHDVRMQQFIQESFLEKVKKHLDDTL